MLPELYYISQGRTVEEHLQHVETVLKAGVRMIQLRIKGVPYEEWLCAAGECTAMCKKFQAICIINDSPEIAKNCGAHGVHTGRQDPDPQSTRNIMGQNPFLLGLTAHSYDEFAAGIQHKPDYIGLGPFRSSPTKTDTVTPLGFKGIADILKKNPVNIPVYAIGGIRADDVPDLLKAGCYGVAVSSDLTGSFYEIEQKVKHYEYIFRRRSAYHS
jgi:thiamine-phosphate pyrophosphorylase